MKKYSVVLLLCMQSAVVLGMELATVAAALTQHLDPNQVVVAVVQHNRRSGRTSKRNSDERKQRPSAPLSGDGIPIPSSKKGTISPVVEYSPCAYFGAPIILGGKKSPQSVSPGESRR
jgi:hypothetical protein